VALAGSGKSKSSGLYRGRYSSTRSEHLTMKSPLLGFEFKRTTTPTITRSVHSAVTDLALAHVDMIHAGCTRGS
jgi:hypothetical protein